MQVLDGHISTHSIKTLVIYFVLVNNARCQLLLFIGVRFIIHLLFVFCSAPYSMKLFCLIQFYCSAFKFPVNILI
jgi:hypothetical protein